MDAKRLGALYFDGRPMCIMMDGILAQLVEVRRHEMDGADRVEFGFKAAGIDKLRWRRAEQIAETGNGSPAQRIGASLAEIG